MFSLLTKAIRIIGNLNFGKSWDAFIELELLTSDGPNYCSRTIDCIYSCVCLCEEVCKVECDFDGCGC